MASLINEGPSCKYVYLKKYMTLNENTALNFLIFFVKQYNNAYLCEQRHIISRLRKSLCVRDDEWKDVYKTKKERWKIGKEKSWKGKVGKQKGNSWA